MLLMPLLTMWHEIGGHAAFCAAQGGRVTTIGAFYVQCGGLSGWARVLMACAGVLVNSALACAAFAAWRHSRGDPARLALWLVRVSEGFVAAGYLLFSGATGFGDLAPGESGGLGPVASPMLLRGGEFVLGLAIYVLLVRKAIRTLAAMIGDGRDTQRARKTIAHVYYATAGFAAVVTGLMNPIGAMITIMSAAASSFGGLAGFISIGFGTRPGGAAMEFHAGRSWPIFIIGAAVLLAFAALLGPSIRI
ncbi:MAG TPA: hypothetical protein VF574_11965 [Allosphingosinicella sp.]|jgi:hypothetical protein